MRNQKISPWKTHETSERIWGNLCFSSPVYLCTHILNLDCCSCCTNPYSDLQLPQFVLSSWNTINVQRQASRGKAVRSNSYDLKSLSALNLCISLSLNACEQVIFSFSCSLFCSSFIELCIRVIYIHLLDWNVVSLLFPVSLAMCRFVSKHFKCWILVQCCFPFCFVGHTSFFVGYFDTERVGVRVYHTMEVGWGER